MSDYEVDVTFTPRFPVSLRSPKSRYRASFKIDGATYSAVSSTPEKAAKGATAMAELMGGYKVNLSYIKHPGHPLIVDLKVIRAAFRAVTGVMIYAWERRGRR